MHGYSLVILLHLFRIPFYQNTCGRLILVTEMKPTGPKILKFISKNLRKKNDVETIQNDVYKKLSGAFELN